MLNWAGWIKIGTGGAPTAAAEAKNDGTGETDDGCGTGPCWKAVERRRSSVHGRGGTAAVPVQPLDADKRITNFGGDNTGQDRGRPPQRRPVTVLWVKGSGGDLGTMKMDGFAHMDVRS